MNRDALFEQARSAVVGLMSDKEVPPWQTVAELEALQTYIRHAIKAVRVTIPEASGADDE
jgi:hypothetical protein